MHYIDVVVNNAGYGVDGEFEAMSDEIIEKQFNTNVFGFPCGWYFYQPHLFKRLQTLII